MSLLDEIIARAMAVVASVETGRISVAVEGNFRLCLSAEGLESIQAKEMTV